MIDKDRRRLIEDLEQLDKELADPARWTQHAFARHSLPEGKVISRCLAGHIWNVAEHNLERAAGQASMRITADRVDAMIKALRDANDIEPLIAHGKIAIEGGITLWNDAPERTHFEVQQAVKRALEKVRPKGDLL